MKKRLLAPVLLVILLTSSVPVKALISANTFSGIVTGVTALIGSNDIRKNIEQSGRITRANVAFTLIQCAASVCSLAKNSSSVKAINPYNIIPSIVTGFIGLLFGASQIININQGKALDSQLTALAVAQLAAFGCSLYDGLSSQNSSQEDSAKH